MTIATTGNATDFGNLLAAASVYESGVSNNTTGIFAGGFTPSLQNVIQFVTIASTGNAQDFGDLAVTKGAFGGASDGGGGLQ